MWKTLAVDRQEKINYSAQKLWRNKRREFHVKHSDFFLDSQKFTCRRKS